MVVAGTTLGTLPSDMEQMLDARIYPIPNLEVCAKPCFLNAILELLLLLLLLLLLILLIKDRWQLTSIKSAKKPVRTK